MFLLLIKGIPAFGMEMLYPLYSYPNLYSPGSYIWDDVADANQRIDITAIINHNNGPGGDGVRSFGMSSYSVIGKHV